jgi:hypothetical protein
VLASVLLLSVAGIALADQQKAVDIDDLPKIKVKQGTDVGVLRIVGTSFGNVIIAVLPDLLPYTGGVSLVALTGAVMITGGSWIVRRLVR